MLQKFKLVSKSNRTIGKISSFMLLTGLLSLVQNILTVQIFGTSREVEIYFAALVILTTIERLFNVGVINDILIPTFIKIKEKENNFTAMTSFSLINNWFILFTCIASTILYFGAPIFLTLVLPGFKNIEIQRTVEIFRIIAIFIPIRMFNGMCSIPFKANEIYTVHEKTGIINRIILIALLLIASDLYGINILITGTILGINIRFFYILFLLKKNNLQYQFLFKSDQFSAKWILGKIYIPIIQTLSLQINRWIVLGALTILPQGYLAIYRYVYQLYGQFSSIIIKSVGTVFLTEVSSKDNLYNKEWFSSFLKKKFTDLFLIFSFYDMFRKGYLKYNMGI